MRGLLTAAEEVERLKGDRTPPEDHSEQVVHPTIGGQAAHRRTRRPGIHDPVVLPVFVERHDLRDDLLGGRVGFVEAQVVDDDVAFLGQSAHLALRLGDPGAAPPAPSKRKGDMNHGPPNGDLWLAVSSAVPNARRRSYLELAPSRARGTPPRFVGSGCLQELRRAAALPQPCALPRGLRRASGIGSPLSTETPYVPCPILCSARSTAASSSRSRSARSSSPPGRRAAWPGPPARRPAPRPRAARSSSEASIRSRAAVRSAAAVRVKSIATLVGYARRVDEGRARELLAAARERIEASLADLAAPLEDAIAGRAGVIGVPPRPW